jgi:hypothetical protein
LIGYLSLYSAEGEVAHVEEFALAEQCECEVFSTLAAQLGRKLRVRISGYDIKTLKRCEDRATITVSQPALFRIIRPKPLENAALSLGLDSDVLYAPYLT